MKSKLLLLTLLAVSISKAWAQQVFTVTDSVPVMVNGLQIGYHIKSAEVKAVGDKGNFSRYAIKFFVTNTTNAPLIIPYAQGPNPSANGSSLLVRFNILNATGARFTSNMALINAMPLKTFTLVNQRDPQSNKIIQVQRVAQVGFQVQAGQTISVDEIVIVPLNQLPNVQAVYIPGGALPPPPPPPAGYAVNPAPVQSMPPPVINIQGFLKLKNVLNNTYLNIQTGMLSSSPIQNGWFSAHWQLVPVPGTNYFNIKNRWKGDFINTNGGNITISINPQSPASMWSLEPTQNPNVFLIKNAKTGSYLSMAYNNLALSNNVKNNFSAAWQVEQL